jgi:hypothetical protein
MADDSAIPASIVLILPTNGLGAGVEVVKAVAANLVAGMSEGDRAAIIHLETRAPQLQPFTSDRSALLSRIALIREVGEDHALLDAVNFATSLLASEQGRRQAVFLLTHRENQGGTITNAGAVVANVRTRGIPIYSLAFGAGLESGTLGTLLKSLTQESHGALVTDDGNLSGTAGRLAGIFRAQYATTYNAPASDAATLRLSYADTETFFAERSRPACSQ